MKIAVVVFPGSNCDIDIYEALHTVCGADVEYVSHKRDNLDGFDAVMLPGGFSYGDYLRCGAIARFANIMPAIVKMADEGKPVFGTCNGFQILTEAGLLPGAEATMRMTRRFRNWKKTIRLFSAMRMKIRMARCMTSPGCATNAAMF